MRYPKGYYKPIPADLEAERVRLTELLRKIDRRYATKHEPAPDAALVDEYNAAVEKFNKAVNPINPSRKMISVGYNGKSVTR